MSAPLATALARAPSNIALIKYMGKKTTPGNIPENGSLSVTLDSLCTFAEIQKGRPHLLVAQARQDHSYLPEPPSIPKEQAHGKTLVPNLDSKAIDRALEHLARVRTLAPEVLLYFGLAVDTDASFWELRTANTFPAASGIASSASSFAAITLAAALALAKNPAQFDRAWKNEPALRRGLARISRMGSGSSCRSMDGPFVLWEGEDTSPLSASKTPALAHFVLLVSEQAKSVSSSEAHRRVKSSPLWDGRVLRTNDKLRMMRQALEAGSWNVVARTTWSEAWEMHSLFHTSAEPFSYFAPKTIALLQWLAPFVAGDGSQGVAPPIVTMDAGPNVHLLVPVAKAGEWARRITQAFPDIPYLSDRPGKGAVPILTSGIGSP